MRELKWPCYDLGAWFSPERMRLERTTLLDKSPLLSAKCILISSSIFLWIIFFSAKGHEAELNSHAIIVNQRIQDKEGAREKVSNYLSSLLCLKSPATSLILALTNLPCWAASHLKSNFAVIMIKKVSFFTIPKNPRRGKSSNLIAHDINLYCRMLRCARHCVSACEINGSGSSVAVHIGSSAPGFLGGLWLSSALYDTFSPHWQAEHLNPVRAALRANCAHSARLKLLVVFRPIMSYPNCIKRRRDGVDFGSSAGATVMTAVLAVGVWAGVFTAAVVLTAVVLLWWQRQERWWCRL